MLTSQTVFLQEKLTSFWHSPQYQGTKPGEANELDPGSFKYVLIYVFVRVKSGLVPRKY